MATNRNFKGDNMSWFKNWWSEIPVEAKVVGAIAIIVLIVFFFMSHGA